MLPELQIPCEKMSGHRVEERGRSQHGERGLSEVGFDSYLPLLSLETSALWQACQMHSAFSPTVHCQK